MVEWKNGFTIGYYENELIRVPNFKIGEKVIIGNLPKIYRGNLKTGEYVKVQNIIENRTENQVSYKYSVVKTNEEKDVYQLKEGNLRKDEPIIFASSSHLDGLNSLAYPYSFFGNNILNNKGEEKNMCNFQNQIEVKPNANKIVDLWIENSIKNLCDEYQTAKNSIISEDVMQKEIKHVGERLTEILNENSCDISSININYFTFKGSFLDSYYSKNTKEKLTQLEESYAKIKANIYNTKYEVMAMLENCDCVEDRDNVLLNYCIISNETKRISPMKDFNFNIESEEK